MALQLESTVLTGTLNQEDQFENATNHKEQVSKFFPLIRSNQIQLLITAIFLNVVIILKPPCSLISFWWLSCSGGGDLW